MSELLQKQNVKISEYLSDVMISQGASSPELEVNLPDHHSLFACLLIGKHDKNDALKNPMKIPIRQKKKNMTAYKQYTSGDIWAAVEEGLWDKTAG